MYLFSKRRKPMDPKHKFPFVIVAVVVVILVEGCNLSVCQMTLSLGYTII